MRFAGVGSAASKAILAAAVIAVSTLCLLKVSAVTPPLYGQPGGTILTAADIAVISRDIVSTFGLTAQYGRACVNCPIGDNVGAMLRLVFADGVGGGGPRGRGGPNGCIDPQGDEQGLDTVIAQYAPIAQRYARNISIADLWVLGANLAIQYASTPSGQLAVNGMQQSPGALRLPFRYGRRDEANCLGIDGAFQATLGAGMDWTAMVTLFTGRYGMSVQDIVAIMGSHALGRCETANSGFAGGWTAAQSSFSNLFYTALALRWTMPNTSRPVWFATQNNAQILMLGPDVEILFSDAIQPAGNTISRCPRWNGFTGCTRNTLGGNGSPSSLVVQFSGSISAFYAAYTPAYVKMVNLEYGDTGLALPDQTIGGAPTPPPTAAPHPISSTAGTRPIPRPGSTAGGGGGVPITPISSTGTRGGGGGGGDGRDGDGRGGRGGGGRGGGGRGRSNDTADEDTAGTILGPDGQPLTTDTAAAVSQGLSTDMQLYLGIATCAGFVVLSGLWWYCWGRHKGNRCGCLRLCRCAPNTKQKFDSAKEPLSPSKMPSSDAASTAVGQSEAPRSFVDTSVRSPSTEMSSPTMPSSPPPSAPSSTVKPTGTWSYASGARSPSSPRYTTSSQRYEAVVPPPPPRTAASPRSRIPV